jgi:hypothetical protein
MSKFAFEIAANWGAEILEQKKIQEVLPTNEMRRNDVPTVATACTHIKITLCNKTR